MSTLDDHYPIACPFCAIATAYPPTPPNPTVPPNPDPDPEAVDPQCHLILSTPHVLAFLDILPIAPGHVLLATRGHYRTLAAIDHDAARVAAELGRWLPVLSRALLRVTGIEDWNVVQNNGWRAAQVVPHVHFHLIPRFQEGRAEVEGLASVDQGSARSWTMFGRGSRGDLDDGEGREMARRLRAAVGDELGARVKGKL